MTRLGGIALLCLACGAQPEINWPEDDEPTVGSAGADPIGGSGGTDAIGGSGGTQPPGGTGGLGGSVATGGAPATGGVTQGGSATGGAFPTGGTATGGAFSTGGTQPTGGAFTGGTAGVAAQGGSAATGGAGGAGGSGGSGGRLLWTHDFSYDGTLSVGAGAKHELRFFLNYPSDMATPCLTVTSDNVPHGTTGATSFEVGSLLRNCLNSVPTTSLSRHTFNLRAESSSAVVTGGGNFELPPESRNWMPRVVIRRITSNAWNPGSVTVRETWEIRE